MNIYKNELYNVDRGHRLTTLQYDNSLVQLV